MRAPIRPAAGYGAAVLFIAAAVAARWLLDPWLGDSQPLSLLFGGVALAVWLGGAGPAVAATVLGYLASDYLFTPPRHVFAVVDARGAISVLTYVASCAIIIVFGEGMRRANRKAEQYADSLRTAEKRKDEFLATLGHELRNLLAPIGNATEMLHAGAASPDAAQRARSLIERQLAHMVRLVDDLLDISRIASGRLRLQKERLDLLCVLEHAVETAQPKIDASGHTLHLSLPCEPLAVFGDPTRLIQVFANLLNNAARYTPRGGNIRLSARRDGASTVVSVCDDGIGITSEAMPRIFEMFVQGDGPGVHTRGGLGIGLTLVRKLVELHDGTITAHSGGSGAGSEFVVRLPALPAHAVAAHESSHSGAARAA